MVVDGATEKLGLFVGKGDQIDPDLNVIVITGYPDSEILDRILQVSPVTVLKKPLKIEQLNQTLNILGHKTPKLES
jgi:response regulator of citrate/malate metabolism